MKTIASDDDEIGKGKYALTTDKSGKFWGSAGAGGIFYSTSTKKFLLAFRSEMVNEPHTWGVWGGAIDKGETPLDAIKREIREETGYQGKYELIPSYVYKKGDFQYHNYIITIDKEFKPHLDWETEKYGWFDIDNFPSPLHFGLKALLPYLKKLEVNAMNFKERVEAQYQIIVGEAIPLEFVKDVAKKLNDTWKAGKHEGDIAIDAHMQSLTSEGEAAKWAMIANQQAAFAQAQTALLTIDLTTTIPVERKILMGIPFTGLTAEDLLNLTQKYQGGSN